MKTVEDALSKKDGVGIRTAYTSAVDSLSRSRGAIGKHVVTQRTQDATLARRLEEMQSQGSAHPFKGYEQIISAYFEALAHQDTNAERGPMRAVGRAVPTFPKDRGSHQGTGVHGTPYGIVLLLLSFLCSVASASSNAWPFPTRSSSSPSRRTPTSRRCRASISGQKTAARWTGPGGYYRIDGKMYKNAVAHAVSGQGGLRVQGGVPPLRGLDRRA